MSPLPLPQVLKCPSEDFLNDCTNVLGGWSIEGIALWEMWNQHWKDAESPFSAPSHPARPVQLEGALNQPKHVFLGRF